MAEHVASASCIKIHMQRNLFKQRGIEHRSSHLKAAQRYFTYQRCKLRWLPTYKISKNSGPCFSNLKVSRCLSKTSLSCCMGSLASSDVLAVSDWIPVGDQILLIASMLLAYMAGVIPVQKSNSASGEKKTDDVVLGSSTVSGSARDGDDQVDLKHVWDVLRRKLLDSLDSIEQGYDIGKAVLEYEQQHAKLPLSLSAVAEGPKLRLLWASFEQLEQEVNKSSGTYDTMSIDDYITVFPKIIQNSLEAICSSWLEKELNSFKIHKVLVSFMIERLNGDKTILLNIINSGKGGLYAELLSFLRFGFQRKVCSYDHSLFTLYGDSILEDLVIAVADGVASIYLELISVDGNLSDEISSLGLTICSMSTRALQKLRNEVVLNQWWYQNVEAVVSMYEDRFDLWRLKSKLIEGNDSRNPEENNWLKFLKRSETRKVPSTYVVLSHCSMPVKRMKELRALTGWRYYFSLLLELSDITMPMVRRIIDKISSAISFFLVCLIGRSLGLIYTGIRQSLRWK